MQKKVQYSRLGLIAFALHASGFAHAMDFIPLSDPAEIQGDLRLGVTEARATARRKDERAASAARFLYSRLRWILPETVFGSSSLKTTMRGYLYGAVCVFT